MWGYLPVKLQKDNPIHPSGSDVRDRGADLGNNSDGLYDNITGSQDQKTLDSTKFDPLCYD